MIPPRLRLPKDETNLFDRAREELKPSTEVRDQVRARLRATVATPGLAPRPRLEAIPDAAPRARGPRRLPGTRLSLGLVGVVAIAGTSGLLIRSWLPARLDTRESAAAPASIARTVVGGGPNPAPVPAPIPATSPPTTALNPLPLAPRPTRAHSRPRAAQVAPPLAALPVERALEKGVADDAEGLSDNLSIEARLLERARSDLREGDLVRARDDLEEHRTRFPSGRLTEEREALLVESALRTDGPDAARSLLEAFRHRFPRSFLLPALESALGRDEP
jgi:hypothetical protein